MGKAKLGFLLAGAYALGLAVLVAVGLSLPGETRCRVQRALAKAPSMGRHAAQVVRVAMHAGSLGMKHLPAAFGPQTVPAKRHSSRFCIRDSGGDSESGLLQLPEGSLEGLGPALVRVVLERNDR
jgi:hypothetical protein